MQRVQFQCDECEAKGSVKLGEDYEDYRVEFCPCCGAPLELDYDEDDE